MKPKVKKVSEIENELFSRVALSSISNKVKRRKQGEPKTEDSTKNSSLAKGSTHQSPNVSQLWSSSAEIFQDLGVDVLDDQSGDSFPDNLTQPSKLPHNVSRSVVPTRPTLRGSHFRCVAEDLVLFKRRRSDGPLGQDLFSKLSDEILLHVFKWLPKTVLSRCTRVCKRWKALVFDESLWKRLDLSKCNLKPGALGGIIGRGVIALRMSLSEVAGPIFSDSAIRICKLQYLDLSMATIPADALAELVGACNSLKKLSLENCQVNNEVCTAIGNNADMETLNMCMCSGITTEGISSILTGCQNMESLNLAWAHLTESMVCCLLDHIPRAVSRLNISGCRQTMADAYVCRLIERCPDLLELDISDGSALTGASIEAIASGLKNLQHLHASHIYGINPVHFMMLTHVASLRRLEVFGLLNDTSLQALRQTMPHIEINKQPFSTVARPTTGNCRTRIWGIKLGD